MLDIFYGIAVAGLIGAIFPGQNGEHQYFLGFSMFLISALIIAFKDFDLLNKLLKFCGK